MNTKKHDLLAIFLFCGFLSIMTGLYLFLPKDDFSENEKRFLEESPVLSWDAVTSGDWGNDAESYMADHIPGRDFFVGLNAYFDLLTGRQEAGTRGEETGMGRRFTWMHMHIKNLIRKEAVQ